MSASVVRLLLRVSVIVRASVGALRCDLEATFGGHFWRSLLRSLLDHASGHYEGRINLFPPHCLPGLEGGSEGVCKCECECECEFECECECG